MAGPKTYSQCLHEVRWPFKASFPQLINLWPDHARHSFQKFQTPSIRSWFTQFKWWGVSSDSFRDDPNMRLRWYYNVCCHAMQPSGHLATTILWSLASAEDIDVYTRNVKACNLLLKCGEASEEVLDNLSPYVPLHLWWSTEFISGSGKWKSMAEILFLCLLMMHDCLTQHIKCTHFLECIIIQ